MEKKKDIMNLLKGICIFIMLWSHSINNLSVNAPFDYFNIPLYRVYHTFTMPLFMMIAGYLFWYSLGKRTFVEAVTHRTRQMLQPAIMCGTIVVLTYNLPKMLLKDGAAALGTFLAEGVGVEPFTKYWFFWSALACSIVVAIMWKAFKKPFSRILGLILGVFLLCVFPSTERSVYLYPFFAVAFVYHEYEPQIKEKLNKLRFVPLIVFPVLAVFYKKEHIIDISGVKGDTVMATLSLNLFRWTVGLFGCLFVIVITRWAYDHLNKGFGVKVFDYLELMGKKSMQMYCIQLIVLEKWIALVFEKAVEVIGTNYLAIKGVYELIVTPVSGFLVSLIVLWIIKWLEKKNLAGYIFGR